jgi:hypothetical protein
LVYYGKRCYRIRDVVVRCFILKMEGNKKMKVKNKFIIGVATLLSMGTLLASPVKAGVDEDEAVRLGISVEEYRQLRDEANRYGFQNIEELRAAIAAGFDPNPMMYGPNAAQDFRELGNPEFQEFLARIGMPANADTYREFIANRQREQAERQMAVDNGFQNIEELRAAIAAGFDPNPMMYGPAAAQDFRDAQGLGIHDAMAYRQFIAERQREQAERQMAMDNGFHDVEELRAAIAAGFDPMTYVGPAAADFRDAQGLGIHDATTYRQFVAERQMAVDTGFQNAEELRAAREAGFDPMTYGPTAALDFRDFQALIIDPEFQAFLDRIGMPANADTYRQFIANR